ncbi:hypothetical protein QRD89_17030 [Halobacillus sp. ACCC02827]|uniref:hypothetical protein n=1 Tax=Bacillaceae TaxID=186817 RepID=UPI0002A519A6|nr:MULTISPECIES: hypothetical protein [Bacillaceae]ELK49036.1 hypothetical protein D479_00360 [Halobacillus sp. BAB-2008]QHT48170.1 hypothetical protein M662_17350 [Bacillus sp. SB49]WJE15404.1 hypothetical protein QRD89_17030 [Halobacillus sp. ACCC02827]
MYIEKTERDSYQIKGQNGSIGSFHIRRLPAGIGKLERLQVSREVKPGHLLAVFELIQKYVKETDLRALLVESHSETLDFLLQHQSFQRDSVESGVWIYEVNNK